MNQGVIEYASECLLLVWMKMLCSLQFETMKWMNKGTWDIIKYTNNTKK